MVGTTEYGAGFFVLFRPDVHQKLMGAAILGGHPQRLTCIDDPPFGAQVRLPEKFIGNPEAENTQVFPCTVSKELCLLCRVSQVYR